MKFWASKAEGTLKSHGVAAVLAASMVLAACSGSDDTTTEETTEETTTAQLQSVSGTVEKPSDVTIARRSIGEELLAALSDVVSQVQAAVGGLEPAASVRVALVRLNDEGDIAEELAVGATDGNGDFILNAEFDATGDVVVRAGGTDPLRAPAGGEDVQVNPVSETIVRNVVERAANGSEYSDFSATELATLVNVITDELDAADLDFTGATSIDGAVADIENATTKENSSETLVDELVADSEGDPSIELAGDMNLANIGFGTDVSASEALITILSENKPTSFVEGPGLDFSGQTITVFESEASWDFSNDAPNFVAEDGDFQVDQSLTEETADEPPVYLSIGSSGRLTTEDGGKGAISSDGNKFVFSDTDDNDFSDITFGVARGDPGTLSETYNIVSYSPYFDDTLNDNVADNGFFPAQVVNLIGTRHSLEVDCASGSCNYKGTGLDGNNIPSGDVEVGATTNAADQRYYVQSGPKGFRSGDGGPNAGDPQFQIYPSFLKNFDDTIAVSSNGVLSEDTGSQATRGFLAADGSMILLQFEANNAATGQQFPGFPGTAIWVGLPKGDSCDNSTLSGNYNVATHGTVHRDADQSDTFDGEFETQTSGGFSINFDGEGNAQTPDHARTDRVLSFGASPDLIESAGVENGESFSYSVNPDCTVDVVDQGGAEGEHFNGIVSPDGESIVFGDFTNEGNLSGNVSVQLLAGFREPAP